MALFLYGTLRHLPLLDIVLGDASSGRVRRAALPGHVALRVAGAGYPMIVPRDGGAAEGLILDGVTAEERMRLDFYEGGYAYALAPAMAVSDGFSEEVEVYFPVPGVLEPAGEWDLARWQEDEADLTCRAAREVMERLDRNDVATVARLYPFIRARAWAQGLGAAGAPATLRRQPGPDAVELRPREAGFDGFFRLKSFDIRHRRFDGSRSDWFGRECFVAYDAALVLPYDPASDCVALVEQLRYGPIWRGDPNPWTLEPIAGLVDAGEDPADTARREAVEEAGLRLGDLRPMMKVYPSPGYSSEFFHCFLGLCDLGQESGTTAGLADENEDIRTHILPFDKAMALVDSGEINAAPLAAMLLWLASHRAGLRASA